MATPRYIQNPSTAASDQLRSELGSYLGQIMNRKKAMDNFALQLRAQDNDFERSLIERDMDRKEKLDAERRADERYFDRLKEQREYSEGQARKRREEAKEDAKEARKLRIKDAKDAEARVNKLALERSYNAAVSAAVLAGVDEKHIVANPDKVKDLKKATVDLSRHIKEATDANKDTEDLERRRDSFLDAYQKIGQKAREQKEGEELGAYVNDLATNYKDALALSKKKDFEDNIRLRYENEVEDQNDKASIPEMIKALARQGMLTEIELRDEQNLALRFSAVKSQYAKLRKMGAIEEIPEDQLNNIDNLDGLEIGVYGATTRMEADRFDKEIKEKTDQLGNVSAEMERLLKSDSNLRKFSVTGIVQNEAVARRIAALAPAEDQEKIVRDLMSGNEALIGGIVLGVSPGIRNTTFTKTGQDGQVAQIIESVRTERLKNLSNDAVDKDGNINPAGLAVALNDLTNGPEAAKLYQDIERLSRDISFIDRDKREYLQKTSRFDPKNSNAFYYSGGSSIPQAPPAASAPPATPATSRPPAVGKPGGNLPAPNDDPGSDLSPGETTVSGASLSIPAGGSAMPQVDTKSTMIPDSVPTELSVEPQPNPADEDQLIMQQTGVVWDGSEPPINAIMRRMEDLNRQMERSAYPEYDEIQKVRLLLDKLVTKDYLSKRGQGPALNLAPTVQKPTNPETASVPRPLPSVRDAGYTRPLPSLPPYSVVGERAQYEEDNFLPAPSVPVAGPAPVPMSPSDFTMIDGQIVPKQPAPAKPHPYANAPSVPPPVDQRYYEPLDTTSQGFNLPQYIQVPERYPHPSEADIDYRISRMYPGPVLPSQSPAPVPQTSVPTPQVNPVMGAVQSRTQGIRSELEAMRAKDAAKEQIVRDWENRLISLEEMEKRLIQIERGPAGPSIPIPQP